MKRFKINNEFYVASACCNDVLINPRLPKNFDNTPNSSRPASHQKFWNLPYIVSMGPGYEIRCLDGGAWDRATFIKSFDTVIDAIIYLQKHN